MLLNRPGLFLYCYNIQTRTIESFVLKKKIKLNEDRKTPIKKEVNKVRTLLVSLGLKILTYRLKKN